MKQLIFLLSIVAIGCNSNNKAPLFEKDMTSESERKNTLFAFVGKKLSVIDAPQDSNSMDAHFVAKYKILQRVYGHFPNEVIEFEVYDHYGIPRFSHYETVLLFVTEFKGKYYHQKYQYYDVYPTEDGKWAGVYHEFIGFDAPAPTKQISFSKEVQLPLRITNDNGDTVQIKYSFPYFEIIGDKAYPRYGYSVEELFNIKKNGVLKWRGLFGKGNENWADSFVETRMAEIKKDSIK